MFLFDQYYQFWLVLSSIFSSRPKNWEHSQLMSHTPLGMYVSATEVVVDLWLASVVLFRNSQVRDLIFQVASLGRDINSDK